MKIMSTMALTAVALLCYSNQLLAQGNSLIPPAGAFNESGEPVSSMKSLDQVEPRFPILQLPYQITNEGSYYLVSSMQGQATNDGIIIRASNVELDLRGFGIFGVTNSLNGIKIEAPGPDGAHNITIINGVIGQWGGYGITGTNASDSELARLKLFRNGSGGVLLGERATIKDCNVDQSQGPGIQTGGAGRISGCKVFGNSGTGIRSTTGAKVTACLVVENAGDGIRVDDFSIVKECQAGQNYTNGISIRNSCLVLENTCAMNGMTNLAGAGIYITGNANRIENNNVNMNYCGIKLTNGVNRVENNHVMGNVFGLVDLAQGNLVMRNSVGNSATNYIVTTNTIYGRIIKNPGPDFLIGNPWANFELGP